MPVPPQAAAPARVRPAALQPRGPAGARAGREEQGERPRHRQRGAHTQQLLARHQLLRRHREIRQHVDHARLLGREQQPQLPALAERAHQVGAATGGRGQSHQHLLQRDLELVGLHQQRLQQESRRDAGGQGQTADALAQGPKGDLRRGKEH